ncbi:PTS galactosamine transporter subunit IIB [Pediococcus acidilactici]|jgi:PTS system galactosamine-specific IIB component|uniref:PTS galactosamine transporter subunit IIB n=2 Tax=Pediococcus acidilactici TaxID=1254 RepID=UPI000FF12055|nr:PTS galactosamine transporter subunit IIB [Pediococcus acidilactici]MCK2074398.1 PTS N-acetylgalactosamine transporter subunit IIB [Pediococcus acidilactici]MDV2603795.1 PTS galactosamine transporter subunit IIB [Pediococcus acidilactici]MDV2845213.1 PTS galactosamine transporter subunit IIB [Pediococcus acidilactici]RWY85351.1 PTS N-acetylgalactosamine transporter subunit IIB [Pediococcus acidilactici]WQS22297.1 PTS galactosamine transporter subunit IIB [Pediococcus acidilactici]
MDVMAANILMTRVDNRLVHGQVGVTWTRAVKANLIVVANDDAANDELQQKLMATTADSSGADIRFFTIEKTINVINKAADRQHIFLVVKTPGDLLNLVEGGVPVNKVNVGNMHFAQGKREITKKVYVDDQDVHDLLAVANRGIEIFIQDYPGEKQYPITEQLLK